MARATAANARLWKLTRGRVLWGIAIVLMAGLILTAQRGYFSATLPESDAGGTALRLGSDGHAIAGRLYRAGPPVAHGVLVVVLHGDAPFRNPGYQYAFASALAKAEPGIAVAGLLRPGYADPYGARSDGSRGFSCGDNYGPQAVKNLGNAIAQLKQQVGAAHVLLMGHSGGSVMAADVAALFPGVADQVVLVSCPCNVPAFRRYMAAKQMNPIWLLPTKSLSPLDTVGDLRSGTSVLAISGDKDTVALPKYARTYVEAAKANGLNAELTLLAGRSHEILNDPETLRLVEARVAGWMPQPSVTR